MREQVGLDFPRGIEITYQASVFEPIDPQRLASPAMSFSLAPNRIALVVCVAAVSLFSVYVRPSWSQTSLPPLRNETANSPNYAPSVPASATNATNAAIATASVASTGSAAVSSVILANGHQQVAIFDHAKQTLVVYHIDPSNGDIRLKSVRRTEFDFALEEFNLSEPTPSTVRKNVGR